MTLRAITIQVEPSGEHVYYRNGVMDIIHRAHKTKPARLACNGNKAPNYHTRKMREYRTVTTDVLCRRCFTKSETADG